ncbi:MAG: hypothetical protein AAB587_01070 [Patescibacteria group bacterium]
MDLEEKQKLQKIFDLTQENHKMLKSLHSSLVWQRVWGSLYWVAALGAAIASYYYLQPYIEQMESLYKSVSGAAGNTNALFDSLLPKR